MDARDPASLGRALEGAAVVVNCADYRLNLDVMRRRAGGRGALRRPRRALPRDAAQLELDGEFRAAGLTAILGHGLGAREDEPARGGRRSAARRAIRSSMEIWAATRDPAAAGPSVPGAVLGADAARRAADAPGGAARRRAGRGRAALGRGGARLPGAGRARDGIYTLHSELATLPSSFPSLREASFRLCLSPGLLEKLLALARRASCPSRTCSRRSRSPCTRWSSGPTVRAWSGGL